MLAAIYNGHHLPDFAGSRHEKNPLVSIILCIKQRAKTGRHWALAQ